MLVVGTPVEPHVCGGRTVFVKREDLSSPEPGPRFSKIRGVVEHLKSHREPVLGVLDTYHSKAGWGVAFLGQRLGRKVVVFFPRYKGEEGLRENQLRARSFGAELVELPAGRSAILYHQARRRLSELYPGAYLLPNALKLEESVNATANEVWRCDPALFDGATWVVSVSSGTIAAGVVKGLAAVQARGRVVLHMGYRRSEEELVRYVRDKVGSPLPGSLRLDVVDEGWAYKDHRLEPNPPFPCNEYYDRKAWGWLSENLDRFGADPVVFWNIGE